LALARAARCHLETVWVTAQNKNACSAVTAKIPDHQQPSALLSLRLPVCQSKVVLADLRPLLMMQDIRQIYC